jgi:hypothetical protein
MSKSPVQSGGPKEGSILILRKHPDIKPVLAIRNLKQHPDGLISFTLASVSELTPAELVVAREAVLPERLA